MPIEALPVAQRLCAGAAYYDFDTVLVSEPTPRTKGDLEPQEVEQHWLAHVHERAHYLQHTGTSIGAFLSLVRHDRLMCAQEMLPRLPAIVRSRMARERRHLSGRPILAISRDAGGFEMAPPVPSEPEVADIVAQVLFENWCTSNLFYSSPALRGLRLHRAADAVLACVMRDVSLRSAAELGTTHDPCTADHAALGQAVVTSVHGYDVCTRALFESAALAQELAYMHLTGTPSHECQKRFGSLFGTVYTAPLRAYLSAAGLDDRVLPTALDTELSWFAVICDIALNPPLPPIVTPVPEGLTLDQAMPANRFDALLSRLPSLRARWPRLTLAPDDTDTLLALEAELCHMCFLADVTTYSFPSPTTSTRFAIDDLSDHTVFTYTALQRARDTGRYDHVFSGAEALYASGMTTYDVISCLQRGVWGSRRHSPGELVLCGPSFAMHANQASAHQVVTAASAFVSSPLWAPPLAIDDSDEIRVRFGADEDHAVALAWTGFGDFLLHWALTAAGPPQLPVHYKRAFVDSTNLCEVLTEELSFLLGERLW